MTSMAENGIEEPFSLADNAEEARGEAAGMLTASCHGHSTVTGVQAHWRANINKTMYSSISVNSNHQQRYSPYYATPLVKMPA